MEFLSSHISVVSVGMSEGTDVSPLSSLMYGAESDSPGVCRTAHTTNRGTKKTLVNLFCSGKCNPFPDAIGKCVSVWTKRQTCWRGPFLEGEIQNTSKLSNFKHVCAKSCLWVAHMKETPAWQQNGTDFHVQTSRGFAAHARSDEAARKSVLEFLNWRKKAVVRYCFQKMFSFPPWTRSRFAQAALTQKQDCCHHCKILHSVFYSLFLCFAKVDVPRWHALDKIDTPKTHFVSNTLSSVISLVIQNNSVTRVLPGLLGPSDLASLSALFSWTLFLHVNLPVQTGLRTMQEKTCVGELPLPPSVFWPRNWRVRMPTSDSSGNDVLVPHHQERAMKSLCIKQKKQTKQSFARNSQRKQGLDYVMNDMGSEAWSDNIRLCQDSTPVVHHHHNSVW